MPKKNINKITYIQKITNVYIQLQLWMEFSFVKWMIYTCKIL